MTEAVIYIVTHLPSGKRYVGFTKQSLARRKTGHYSRVRRGSQTKFHRALRESPAEEFEWEIAYKSPDWKRCLSMEDHYIKKFNTLADGLNTARGGGLFPRLSGSQHPMFGNTHSREARDKISANHVDVSGSRNPRSKTFVFESPEGRTFSVEGAFKRFCRDHTLPVGTMIKLLYEGKLPRTGKAVGWTVREM